MTRDEIFAAIVAWTESSPASYPATDAERRTWIDAQEGISATLEASNDAEWLRIIADAVLGAEIRAELRRCGILTAEKANKEANWPTGNSSAVMYAVADIFAKEQVNGKVNC